MNPYEINLAMNSKILPSLPDFKETEFVFSVTVIVKDFLPKVTGEIADRTKREFNEELAANKGCLQIVVHINQGDQSCGIKSNPFQPNRAVLELLRCLDTAKEIMADRVVSNLS